MLREKEIVAAKGRIHGCVAITPRSGTPEAPIKFRRKRREAMFN
ncbi:hypothetical protein [Erythrobacter donghaensis]|nr:hypothetical protein [Erythrobacter donghaensis]